MGLKRRLWARLFPRWFLWRGSPTHGELGELGERLAAAHLARQGWRIRARRLPSKWGEIDLVLERGSELALVEVKSGRRGPRFRPLDRVDRATERRLHAAAAGLARRAGTATEAVHVLFVEIDTSAPRKPRIEVHSKGTRVEGGGIRYVRADDPRSAP